MKITGDKNRPPVNRVVYAYLCIKETERYGKKEDHRRQLEDEHDTF